MGSALPFSNQIAPPKVQVLLSMPDGFPWTDLSISREYQRTSSLEKFSAYAWLKALIIAIEVEAEDPNPAFGHRSDLIFISISLTSRFLLSEIFFRKTPKCLNFWGSSSTSSPRLVAMKYFFSVINSKEIRF